MDDKQKAIAYATLIPAASMGIGMAVWYNKSTQLSDYFKKSKKPGILQKSKKPGILQKSKKPSWAPNNDTCYTLMDIATTIPMTYGAYLVHRAGGFDYADSKLALLAYAGMHVHGLMMLKPILDHNYSRVFWAVSAHQGLTAAMALLFAAVDKKAAMCCLPALWWGHIGVLLCHSMAELNVGGGQDKK